MSVLNDVVAMELDSAGYEGPSTPLRDPASSPAVHIQWQNSQSACAAMEELRVASSVPRPPKPLTFDFELPASAGPSSHASDPFFSSRTRLRSARSRNIDRIQSRSQNDVFATPVADASKFLDMLGRASARVDENSRKRMKALGERERGPKRSSIKGKERSCAKTRGTRSMDELGDHTNFIRDVPETKVHHSSLPIMLESQSKDTAEYKNDVHMHNGTAVAAAAAAAVPAPGNDGTKPPVSTRPQNGTQPFPPRATLSTRHFQKRIEPPSPTPVRSSAAIPFRPMPAPAHTPEPVHRHQFDPRRTSDSLPPKPTSGPLPHASDIYLQQSRPTPTPLPPAVNSVLKGAAAASAVPMTDSLVRHGRSASSSSTTATAPAAAAAAAATSTSTSNLSLSVHPPPSQTKRALGMTRAVPRSFSSSSSNNNTPHSAATKKPFRPPLVRPTAAAAAAASQATTVPAATKPQIRPTSSNSHSHDSRRQRRHEDSGKKGSGADPDSSFDISFDFDPEALEAAMKKYD